MNYWRLAPLETLTDESLSKVAIIPEIDQFLTDPQVPFLGALGRFNRGGRLGHFDTAWGWRRTTVDGDWLRSLMEAAGLKAAVGIWVHKIQAERQSAL